MISTPEKPVAVGGTILYFRVQDLPETHRILEQKGVYSSNRRT